MLSSYPSWKVIGVWFSVRPCQRRPNTSLLCRCKNVLLCRRHACVGAHNNYTIERHFRAAHCCFSLSHGYFSMSWMKQSRFLHLFFLPLVTFTTQMSLLCFRKLQEVKRLQPKPLSELKCLSFFVAKHPKAKYFKNSSADDES